MSKIHCARKIFSNNDDIKNLYTTIIKLTCLVIVLFINPSKWYKVAHKIYCFIRPLKYFYRYKKETFEIKRVYILNQILSLLTRTNIAFHIPYHFDSAEIKNEKGILFCSSHMPLIKVGIKAMVENNYTIDSIIALKPTNNGKVSIWGMSNGVNALKADNNVLLKLRTILSKKSNVALMVDDTATNKYSGNSMKICKLTGSKAAFIFAILKDDGTISTWLESAPFPYCNTNDEIEKNIAYLKMKTVQIFEKYRTFGI